LRIASELDLSSKSDIEYHEVDESEEPILQETYMEVIEPTKLEFNDTVLSVEYESFSYGFGINNSFDESFVLNMNLSHLIPLLLTSFLSIASLNLFSLRILPLRILI